MSTYLITVKFENGDEVQTYSEGRTAYEAADRVTESPQFKAFKGLRKIEGVYYELVKTCSYVQVDATRYDFRPSQEHEGWYVVTDKKDLLVVIFEKGRFNETQHINRLDDNLPDPLTAASGLRAIADYLKMYHPEVL